MGEETYNYCSELHSDSLFLGSLNGGEKEGRHLRKDVQYANIMGQVIFNIPLPFIFTGKIYYYGIRRSDDGLITHASSHLKYVWEHIFPGKKHSPAVFYAPGIGLTVARDVWEKIIELLLHDIPRGT